MNSMIFQPAEISHSFMEIDDPAISNEHSSPTEELANGVNEEAFHQG